ncbi:MAG: AAA family ATPase [Chloroflexaceae bacterium]|nr:AAA family ATPase [Chloroflexaceae bacterium]
MPTGVTGVDGGDTVTFVTVLENQGSQTAYNVMARDMLPTGLTLQGTLAARFGDGTAIPLPVGAEASFFGAGLSLPDIPAAAAALRSGEAPDVPSRYDAGQWIADLAATPEGLPVFWNGQYRIPAGGITIVAAPTGAGKTTTMLNLLAHWLETTSGTYLFSSYEERKPALILKLLMVLAGVVIDEATNTNAYLAYTIGTYQGEPIPAIDAALDKLAGWLEDGRLIVTDTSYTPSQLSGLIDALAARQRLTGCIVDYMQKVPPDTGRGNVRYLDVQSVSGAMLEIATRHDLPMVIGSQLNDQGRTREGSDIEFDASLVLKMELKDMDVKREGGEKVETPLPPQRCELTVVVTKNRQGWRGRDVLWFNMPARKLSEKDYNQRKGGLR